MAVVEGKTLVIDLLELEFTLHEVTQGNINLFLILMVQEVIDMPNQQNVYKLSLREPLAIFYTESKCNCQIF